MHQLTFSAVVMDLIRQAGQLPLAANVPINKISYDTTSARSALDQDEIPALATFAADAPDAADRTKDAVDEAQRIAATVFTDQSEPQVQDENWGDGDDNDDGERLGRVPDYVYEYAPYVHLYSQEEFWPSDIAEHLRHMKPYVNYTDVSEHELPPNVTNLASFNKYGLSIYMQSKDNVEDRPAWLGSEYGVPRGPASGDEAGLSDAPAVLIVIEKGEGVVDAFWFFFYSYNLGPKVLNIRFGNHVGDWEHTMVRFRHGKPEALFYSEHFFGQAYTYEAMEKYGKRPVSYSGTGTHAMYATAGIHRYVLPLGLLRDRTDRGPLWDPAMNAYEYTFNLHTRELRASQNTPDAPISWFYYLGHWGDKAYPRNDPRQYEFAGQYHYVDGPNGPRFKSLGRQGMCQGAGECTVKEHLEANQIRRWPDGYPIGAE